jgi:mannose-6-phosphate isomerase-like protein (cupin superfamily)
MDAVLHRQGEGETHGVGGGSSVTIKADGEHTGGTFFLSETVIEPGFGGPPPHVHHQLHDMFYVLEGTLVIRLGDEVVQAGPGTFACVPPHVVHTFSNPGDAPVRFLNFNTPSGWEDYMRDLGREFAGSRRPTPDEIGRIASRYDFHRVT